MAIRQVGESQRFDYKENTVQEFIVPVKGLYKLEVYGASGGYASTWDLSAKFGSPGKGGYSCGYKYFEANTRLYICVGGKGEDNRCIYDEDHEEYPLDWALTAGGYNGGGNPGMSGSPGSGGAGGGCTHIAENVNRGELYNYENFKSEILIVAGGGAGSSTVNCDADPDNGVDVGHDDVGYHYVKGGDGGGLIGGSGEDPGCGYGPGTGGTQTEGGYNVSRSGGEKTYTGKFGRAKNNNRDKSDFDNFDWGTVYTSGAGGGWYGGGNARQEGASGGGSGYIGGVPSLTYKGQLFEPSTTSGENNGNGSAIITLMQRSAPSVYLGTKEISAIYFGTHPITDIKIFN